ncbi:MAG: hypothetical protein V4693_22145 [Pseudomonadota bacterium]
MPDRSAFFVESIQPMESLLLAHPLGGLFTGQLFQGVDGALTSLELRDFGNGPLVLNSEQIARLFMAPDQSLVRVMRVADQSDGSPAGISVRSDNPFVQPGQPVEVIAYRSESGASLQISNLHVRRLMLNHLAPKRWCTVAFGLMAVTAYRLAFREVTLYAAGRGPAAPADPDEFVGFLVWPKLGFDAPLAPVDLQGAQHLQRCRWVQDVMAVDPGWWAEHGVGREMSFDLNPDSRSWRILLDYIYAALEVTP